MTDNLPFKIIGSRYRVLSRLGAGGMGAVYRALDRLNSKNIALKHVLLTEASEMPTVQSEDLRLALSHEFRTLASLHHPHVINVVDHGFDHDRNPFFTMELLEGGQAITDAAIDLPFEKKIDLIIQLLQAMSYLHHRSVIHRDLKPGNVMVSRSGNVKVLDFGLASVVSHSQQNLGETVAGTLAYMAPETLMSEPASIASDLYAVGVIAYEILTEKFPYPRGNIGMMIQYIVNEPVDVSMMDPDIGAVISKLLAKQADARYKTADDVIDALCEAAKIPRPEESVVIRESYLQSSKFIGRDAEFKKLSEALDHLLTRSGRKKQTSSTSTGPRQAWIIGGESGLGKTRLVEEIRVRGLISGLLVLHGQAVYGGGLPFQLWREPMRRLVLDTELDDLDAGVLREVVPDIDTLLERSIPEPPSMDQDGRNKRLIATIIEVFRRQTRPVLLLLEDLQWSVESLEPLKLLVGLVDELPLMIVANFRSEDNPNLNEDFPDMSYIRLERLPEDAIGELATAMLGDRGQHPELLNLLKRESEGNVLFIVEVIRTLAEAAGRLTNINSIEIPRTIVTGGVKKMLRSRLDGLPEEAISLLKLAAVAGRNLDLAVIRNLLSRRDQNLQLAIPENLDVWLILCANTAVLESIDGSWRFTHDKLREALVDELTDEERKKLNRQAALSIEAVHPNDESFAEALADHWHIADDIEQETRFALIAARQLIAISSFARASELTERTLTRLPEGQMQSERMHLLKLKGDAKFYQGDFDEATTAHEASIALAVELKDEKAEAAALAALGKVESNQGKYPAARTHYERSLELRRAQNDSIGTAQALTGLGLLAIHEGDLQSARTYYQESLELSRAANDQRGAVYGLNGLANVCLYSGELDAGLEHLQESLKIWRTIGDRFGIASALNNLGVVSEFKGDWTLAAAYYQDGLKLSREIGDRQGVAIGLTNLGVIAENQASFDVARANYEEALRFFRLIGDRSNTGICLQNLGNISGLLGDYVAAKDFIDEALKIWEELNSDQWRSASLAISAQILRHMFQPEEAQKQADLALELARKVEQPEKISDALFVRGQIAYDRQDYAEAEKLFTEGADLGRENSLPRFVPSLVGRSFAQVHTPDLPAATASAREALQKAQESSNTMLILQAFAAYARLALAEKDQRRYYRIVNTIERQIEAASSDVRDWLNLLYGEFEDNDEDTMNLPLGGFSAPPTVEELAKELLPEDAS